MRVHRLDGIIPQQRRHELPHTHRGDVPTDAGSVALAERHEEIGIHSTLDEPLRVEGVGVFAPDPGVPLQTPVDDGGDGLEEEEKMSV